MVYKSSNQLLNKFLVHKLSCLMGQQGSYNYNQQDTEYNGMILEH